MHQVEQIVATKPRNFSDVSRVEGFYVLWRDRQTDGSRWVTLESKKKFLPSGVHIVKKYYASVGITYQNSWLSVLLEPDTINDAMLSFDRHDVNRLVNSVARRTKQNTVPAACVSDLMSSEAFEGDGLLPGEGEHDPEDFESFIDNLDNGGAVEKITTKIRANRELSIDLCRVLHRINEARIMTVSDVRPRRHDDRIRTMKARFDAKYRSKSKNPFKYYSEGQYGKKIRSEMISKPL